MLTLDEECVPAVEFLQPIEDFNCDVRRFAHRGDAHDTKVEFCTGELRLIERVAIDRIVNEVCPTFQEWEALEDQVVVERADQDERINVVPADLVEVRKSHFLEMEANDKLLMGQFALRIPDGVTERPLTENYIGARQQLLAYGGIGDDVTFVLILQNGAMGVSLAISDEGLQKAEIVTRKQDGRWTAHDRITFEATESTFAGVALWE